MAAFPLGIDTFVAGTANSFRAAVANGVSLAGYAATINVAVTALENKVGVGNSTVAVNQILVGEGAGTSNWRAGATGLTLTNATLITPTIGTATTTGGTLTNTVLSTNTSLDANADPNFTYNSMSRQAVINGNFDIWQRGTSFTNPASGSVTSDRWKINIIDTNATLPTSIINSRQVLTSGDIYNSYYYYRVNANAAGGTLQGVDRYEMFQKIEFGTRYLAGASKAVTVSFWARSSVANKLLGVYVNQLFGTGGSPSAGSALSGTIFTLTSSWQKFSIPFNTATLVGGTFGTNNDDSLQVLFAFAWGTSVAASSLGGTQTSTFGASGNTDIAQVQLCAGSVALPFVPRHRKEELALCHRYCYVPDTSATFSLICLGWGVSTTLADFCLPLPETMRAIPTLSVTAGEWAVGDGVNANVTLTALVLISSITDASAVGLEATVASGLTQFRGYRLIQGGTIGKVMIFDAEL